jgi:tripartite-type tricarboxylate transporter receptor subunit TctC
LAATAGLLGFAADAAWPDDQPIRLVVPQAVGGTNDTVARLIGTELAKALKQSVIVENRPGASG